MATAHIIFQQSGDGYSTPASRDDLALSLPVTVLNQDNTGVTSWAWSIIDKPSASTSSLVSPTSSTTTFTPDIEGTYLVKLIVNSGSAADQKGAAVKTLNYHFRIPAATETLEFDGYRGWATAANLALKLIDDGYTPPASLSTLQAVYNISSPSSFTLNSTNGGLQIHDASTPLGTNLFEVDANGAGTKYFTINSAASTFVGQLLQTGGKVGLGTNTPGAGYTNLIPDLSVHVLKTGFNMFLLDATTDDAGLVFYTQAVGNDAAIYLDQSDSQKIKFAMGVVDSDASRNSNTKITLQQDGAVGIGITSPTSTFHVVGTGHFTGNVGLDGGFTSGAQASMGGFKIVSVLNPTNAQDAATKNYVDTAVTGAGNLGGTLTAPRIPYATGANTLSDSSSLSWLNSTTQLAVDNIRIGLNISPGTIGSSADTGELKFVGGIIAGANTGGSIRLGAGARGDGDISVIQFLRQGAEIARFQGDSTNGNAGSLGIGTNDPRFKIDVIGSGHIDTNLLIGHTPTNNPGTQLLLSNQTASPFFAIQGHPVSAQQAGVQFFNATATNLGQVVSSMVDGSLFIDYHGAQSSGTGVFQLRNGINGANAVIYADNDGYVGINTNTPTNTLDVNGSITVDGYIIDPGAVTPIVGDSLVYDGSAFVPTPIIVPIISDNTNLLLTTTSATNVISYSPALNGDIVVFIYYRVVTATTTLGINITWNDAGGSRTFIALASSAQTVGNYSLPPLYIQAQTSAPVVVVATAATANRVYVSASSMTLNSSVNTGAEPAVAEEADIFDYHLTTTSTTNVLAFTPPVNENFFVYIYYRVATATTNVTIDITFNDNAGAQIMNILPITAKTVGSYSVAPVYIQATTSAPIIVAFTAGTANNVYVSATILMV